MPDAGARRKRQIPGCRIPSHLKTQWLPIEARSGESLKHETPGPPES
jgi:hypothetical protein